MADFESQTARGRISDVDVDTGLRNFMMGVYAKMALGLLLTGAIAWTVANVPAIRQYFFAQSYDGRLHFTALGQLAQWLPIGILLIAMFTRAFSSPQASGFLYWVVVSSIGVSGAVWFLVYQLGSVAGIFLITAASFGAMSLWGYVTKRDMSTWGRFLFMAMFGLFAASIASIFIPGMTLGVSVIGVLLFAVFTAYDTQKLKGIYYQVRGSQYNMAVVTNMGALNFYLDFVNMFQFLLSLGGSRR
jgi:FtsH-binding integral membrane protein